MIWIIYCFSYSAKSKIMFFLEYLAYWRENTGQPYNFHKSWFEYRMLAQHSRARGYPGSTAHTSRTGVKGAWGIRVHTVSNDYIKARSTGHQPWGKPRGFLFPQKCGFLQETHDNKLYHMAPNQKLTFKQLPKNCPSNFTPFLSFSIPGSWPHSGGILSYTFSESKQGQSRPVNPAQRFVPPPSFCLKFNGAVAPDCRHEMGTLVCKPQIVCSGQHTQHTHTLEA